MPDEGSVNFKGLKKAYAKGIQLRGRTIGIIGFGRIGQETAKIALGLGMKVLPVDLVDKADVSFNVGGQDLTVALSTVSMDEMLAQADVISNHVPFGGQSHHRK